MGDEFDAKAHGLKPVHCESVGGYVWICLADRRADFSAFRDSVEPYARAARLTDAKVAFESTLVENGNWKLVMENARECYHCAGSHPELSLTFPSRRLRQFRLRRRGPPPRRVSTPAWPSVGLRRSGPLEGDWWQAMRFPLNEGCRSMTMDGRTAVKKLMCEAGDGDIGSLRWSIEPHSFVHATADTLFMFSAMPLEPEGDADHLQMAGAQGRRRGRRLRLEHLTELWNRTNLQDLRPGGEQPAGRQLARLSRPAPTAPTPRP